MFAINGEPCWVRTSDLLIKSYAFRVFWCCRYLRHAEAFTAEFKDILKFDHEQGFWFQWDGVRWALARKQEAFHHVRLVGRRLGNGKKQFSKASVASGVEKFARADPRHAVTSDLWDEDLRLLGTPDGTVELRSGKLRPPAREDFITKTTRSSPTKGPAALWKVFLHDCTGGDADQINYLKRIAGYCLGGLTNEHALFFLYGPGGNGKSVFLNVLSHVLGDYAITAPMDSFVNDRIGGHPADVALLRGARLVTASETEEGRAWSEPRIKNLTGGEPITARHLYKNYFTFLPQCKLLFSGNHLPNLKSVDAAMRRRLKILPFLQTPAIPDSQLEENLKEEAAQILNWMIEGCLDWQREGLGESETVFNATADYFEAQDTLGQWVEERCVGQVGAWEQPQILFNDWAEYTQAQGEPGGGWPGAGGSPVNCSLHPQFGSSL